VCLPWATTRVAPTPKDYLNVYGDTAAQPAFVGAAQVMKFLAGLPTPEEILALQLGVTALQRLSEERHQVKDLAILPGRDAFGGRRC